MIETRKLVGMCWDNFTDVIQPWHVDNVPSGSSTQKSTKNSVS